MACISLVYKLEVTYRKYTMLRELTLIKRYGLTKRNSMSDSPLIRGKLTQIKNKQHFMNAKPKHK